MPRCIFALSKMAIIPEVLTTFTLTPTSWPGPGFSADLDVDDHRGTWRIADAYANFPSQALPPSRHSPS